MQYSEKIGVVEVLADKFANAPITILSDYRGLTVAQLTQLRRKVRAAGGEFIVAKNTLTQCAVRETSNAVIEPMLAGPTALAFGYGDPVAIAKALDEFARDAEALEIKGAVLDGELLEPKRVKQLAKMPSLDQLRGQLLNLLMTPATQLVRVLAAPSQQFVQVLEARRTSGDAPEASVAPTEPVATAEAETPAETEAPTEAEAPAAEQVSAKSEEPAGTEESGVPEESGPAEE